MMPQEREMIATLVERLKKAEGQPKDPEAEALIRQATAAQPDAPYSLVQTALIQELSLQQAQSRIGELERQLAEAKPAASPPPSFLGGAAAAAAAAPSAGTPGRTDGDGFLRSAAGMAAGGAAGALLYQGIGSIFGQSDGDSVAPDDGDDDSVTEVTTSGGNAWPEASSARWSASSSSRSASSCSIGTRAEPSTQSRRSIKRRARWSRSPRSMRMRKENRSTSPG
jgi:hypothetical protein